MIWILPLIGLIVLEAVADIFADGFAQSGKIDIALLALLFYILGNASWLLSLHDGVGLAKGAAIFSITSEILAILIGVALYHEHLSGIQWTGVGLGTFALILIVW